MVTNPEKYSDQETETRVQAALRGARRVGPKPMSSMTPKGVKAQRKKRRKKAK
jgi:hypothetical protein